jgi:putative membrane protein
MKTIFKVLTLASLVAMSSCNETRKDNSNNDNKDSKEVAEDANEDKFQNNDAEKDADFVSELVAKNYEEVKLAQLASQKSASPAVKKVAKMLEAEHNKTLNELKTFAKSKAISIPVEETNDARNDIQKFSDKTAKDFDKDWCKEMVDQHEDVIGKLEDRKEKTDDAELKAWIDKALPELRSHLDEVKACDQKIKDNG